MDQADTRDSIFAAAFAASALPDNGIDAYLDRYTKCIKALQDRRAAEKKAAEEINGVARRPRSRRSVSRGTAMSA